MFSMKAAWMASCSSARPVWSTILARGQIRGGRAWGRGDRDVEKRAHLSPGQGRRRQEARRGSGRRRRPAKQIRGIHQLPQSRAESIILCSLGGLSLEILRGLCYSVPWV
jgi:hypothetical protein